MSKIKFPKELRERWLKALRSGRYKQTDGVLHDRYGQNCCLGVCARLLNIKHKDIIDMDLPANLSQENAKKFPKALVSIQKNGNSKNTNFAYELAGLNDDYVSFEEIADYIEKRTIGV